MNETMRSLVAGAAGAVVTLALVVGQPALAHEADKVNAKKIGMVQTAMSQSGGAAPFRNPLVDPEWAGRSIDKGPNLGLGIDQLSGFVNPLYITTAGAKGDTLTSTGTLGPAQPGGGRHGWRFLDSSGTEQKRSALMNDAPQLNVANNSKQEFETTAVAVQGEQFGTYYGSVRWGWRRDNGGAFTRLPFTKKSDDAPSWLFNTAAGLWNASSTAAGVRHVQLPTATGLWIDHANASVVEDPVARALELAEQLATYPQATMQLPSPPTRPAAIQASTTRSNTLRKMPLSRNRSLRARENAE